VHSIERAGPGDVLVVDMLSPGLATKLPGLAGLVSETGSSLSHLAILAREMHVPTVVAVPGARRRFPEGSRVLVDGLTGEVANAGEEVEP
jgi:pyruvate,water dikinase